MIIVLRLSIVLYLIIPCRELYVKSVCRMKLNPSVWTQQVTVTADTHVLPVVLLLPHPVVLVVHPLVAKLTVRLQGGLVFVTHVDQTHAPAGRRKKEAAKCHHKGHSVTAAGNSVAHLVEHAPGSNMHFPLVKISKE